MQDASGYATICKILVGDPSLSQPGNAICKTLLVVKIKRYEKDEEMMIDQQTKQEIANALKLLNDQNASLRIEAVKQLGKIGISHPQIIEQLKNLATDDWSADVRSAAKNALDGLQNSSNIIHQRLSVQPQLSEPIQRNEEILEILQKQHETLVSIQNLLIYSLGKENEKTYYFRTRITDLDISIGSMIVMTFKWLIASIPVGIILGLIWLFLLLFLAFLNQ